MAGPYREMTDLLALASSSFVLVDDGGPDEEGQSDVQQDSDGTFLQEDTRSSDLKYTHKFNVRIKGDVAIDAANRPRRGLHTGLSGVKYFIDDVKVGDKTKHWTLSVNFHRYADVAASRGTAVAADLVS